MTARIIGLGAAQPEVYCPDDFRIDPGLGLALVTSGLGANDYQARPAAALATWSVAGELEAQADEGALARGARRAHEAIERLSAGWGGLIRPGAMIAALRLAGSQAQLAHAGRCRIFHVGSGGLDALTQDHDLAAEAALTPGAPEVPPELRRITTRALGGTPHMDIRLVPVAPGDEFLLATPALVERLDPAVVAALCRRERPVASRAIALWDHACALAIPFAFVLVRVVAGEVNPRALGGSRRPQPGMFFAPGAPLPPPTAATDRGPDERWFKEIGTPLTLYAGDPLADALSTLADLHPPALAGPALLRALRWILESLASRFTAVPPALQSITRALARCRTLDDWTDDARAAAQDFRTWAEKNLTDWASRQAIDRVEAAFECLSAWRLRPEDAAEELGPTLDELVQAEGLWDWDELAAEAALAFDPIPDDYYKAESRRDEQRLAARRAFILVLAETAAA